MDHSEVKYLPKVDHTPAELDAASMLLLKAAAIIERDGWRQRSCGVRGGPVCIEGALQSAAGNPPDEPILGNSIVYEATRRIRDSVYLAAYEWNDESMRTKEEVIAKLRAVALSG